MSDATRPRRAFPLPASFFCDGPCYVLTSPDFGGSGISADELAEILREAEPAAIEDLLMRGVCLPIIFPGDCALDEAIVVVGELSEREQAEWIGRISSWLDLRSGRLLLVCGGGEPEDLDAAADGEAAGELNAAVDLPPGRYLVEVYAFVSSMTVDFYFEEGEPLEEWCRRTRPGAELPRWLELFEAGRAIGELSDELVSYILRVAPLDREPPPPRLVDDVGWCGEFDFRRPEACPLGITRAESLGTGSP